MSKVHLDQLFSGNSQDQCIMGVVVILYFNSKGLRGVNFGIKLVRMFKHVKICSASRVNWSAQYVKVPPVTYI